MSIELAKIAEDRAEWTQAHVGDWMIVQRAIDYMAAIHDGPWRGAEWFRDVLEMLIEIAVPNTGLDEQSAAFLVDIQSGAGKSYQSAPIEKSVLRITDDIAKSVKTLQQAGCEYGLVSDILDLSEAIFHGERLSSDQRELLLVAATAAPFVRLERINQGIDK